MTDTINLPTILTMRYEISRELPGERLSFLAKEHFGSVEVVITPIMLNAKPEFDKTIKFSDICWQCRRDDNPKEAKLLDVVEDYYGQPPAVYLIQAYDEEHPEWRCHTALDAAIELLQGTNQPKVTDSSATFSFEHFQHSANQKAEAVACETRLSPKVTERPKVTKVIASSTSEVKEQITRMTRPRYGRDDEALPIDKVLPTKIGKTARQRKNIDQFRAWYLQVQMDGSERSAVYESSTQLFDSLEKCQDDAARQKLIDTAILLNKFSKVLNSDNDKLRKKLPKAIRLLVIIYLIIMIVVFLMVVAFLIMVNYR